MSDPVQQELLSGITSLVAECPQQLVDQLCRYLDLLDQWNRSYNLTAVRNKQAMVGLHVLDSLAVLPFLGDGAVIDVGSGAGLPGIPLALAKPEQTFTLLDTNGKKTRFLTQAKIALRLDNVSVVHSRVEQHSHDGGYDIVISRAYASTDDFITSTSHLHHDGTRVLVMQGKLEPEFSTEGYQLNATRVLDVPGLDADRHLLEIARADV